MFQKDAEPVGQLPEEGRLVAYLHTPEFSVMLLRHINISPHPKQAGSTEENSLSNRETTAAQSSEVLREMGCVRHQSYLCDSYVITYPIPPYMSLREMIGFRPSPPLKGYYIMDDEEQVQKNVYKKDKVIVSPIQDIKNNAVIYNAFNGALVTDNLQGQNKGTPFEITTYLDGPPKPKIPITLKIASANLYLSYTPSEGLKKENIGSLDVIDQSAMRFLFFRTNSTRTTFESALSPGMFICTAGESNKPVTVASGSDNKKVLEFRIKSEQVVGTFNIVGNRLTLQATRTEKGPRLEEGINTAQSRLLEDDLEWPNIYNKFAYRAYQVCW